MTEYDAQAYQKYFDNVATEVCESISEKGFEGIYSVWLYVSTNKTLPANFGAL